MHDLDAYLHSQLLLAVRSLTSRTMLTAQALTLALTLMAPQATLIFKIFLSPLDPHASMLRSQLQLFFPAPLRIENDVHEYAEFDDSRSEGITRIEDLWEQSSIGKQGYDKRGRRGGVWVRKPRSSRPGSGGQRPSPHFLNAHCS